MRNAANGESGKLYIGGVQVERGYINPPKLTEEWFITDLFTGVPRARFDKTGDLYCYLATDDLMFLVRVDQQVKIKGNLFELGAIESVLESHEAVKQDVVVALEEELREDHLVAYVVFRPNARREPAKLRLHFERRLPDYIIP